LATIRNKGVPAIDFEVGTQRLNGSGLTTVRFSNRELDKANDEFRKLGEQVKRLAP
jgi:hypothetical protein